MRVDRRKRMSTLAFSHMRVRLLVFWTATGRARNWRDIFFMVRVDVKVSGGGRVAQWETGKWEADRQETN